MSHREIGKVHFRLGTLLELMDHALAEAGAIGLKQRLQAHVATLLGVSVKTYLARWSRNRLVSLAPASFDTFARDMHDKYFEHPAFGGFRDPRALRLRLQGMADRTFKTRVAEERVVECVTAGPSNLINTHDHDPVDTYVDVRVDDVRFYHEDGVLKSGRYIRISTPPERGQGAVILPIDIGSGAIQMITQHRYPINEFVTELPRGFGDVTDIDERAVALRELREETGHDPIKINAKILGDAGEEAALIPLASLYPDSGKLADKVGFFLAFVDRETVDTGLLGRRPGLESPIWVSIVDAYRAVISRDIVTIDVKPEDRVLHSEEIFPVHTAIDDGYLQIADGFTYAALMAARPILCEIFPWLAKVLRQIERRTISGQLALVVEQVRNHGTQPTG